MLKTCVCLPGGLRAYKIRSSICTCWWSLVTGRQFIVFLIRSLCACPGVKSQPFTVFWTRTTVCGECQATSPKRDITPTMIRARDRKHPGKIDGQDLLATPTRKLLRGHPTTNWYDHFFGIAWSRHGVEP